MFLRTCFYLSSLPRLSPHESFPVEEGGEIFRVDVALAVDVNALDEFFHRARLDLAQVLALRRKLVKGEVPARRAGEARVSAIGASVGSARTNTPRTCTRTLTARDRAA